MSGTSGAGPAGAETARRNNVTVIAAEACTAGKLATHLSEAPGAGELLHGSFVTVVPRASQCSEPLARLCVC
jgi:nicotinamide mononucleotide (NMN) deamidase PncC